jgi:hypothetical protein
MMLAYRFVRLIESHADDLAENLLRRVQQSPLTRDYHKVPQGELKQRVRDIYRHLGEWLLDKGELDIELRYVEIGVHRAQQGVPLSQVIWAIVLTKENLWDFVRDESVPDRPVEIFGELELLRLLDQFFDRAICAMAAGYEKELATREQQRELKAIIGGRD